MTCRACLRRAKNWHGSDPKCAFPNGGRFTADNWNCATMDHVRDLCEPQEVRLNRNYDDQHFVTVDISHLELFSPGEDGCRAYALWVSWYKSRGQTEALWMLGADGEPWRPTEADCLTIVADLRSNPRDRSLAQGVSA